MADRVSFDLEAALIDLGDRVAFPPTPDLATAVQARLFEGRRQVVRVSLGDRVQRVTARLFGRPVRRGFVLALAILLLVVGAAIAVGLGLRGLQIVFVDTLPSQEPTASAPSSSRPAPVPGGRTPLAGDLGLGQPASLGDVRALSSIRVLAPTTEFGQPVAWLGHTEVGPLISLAYPATDELPGLAGSEVGLLVMEFGGRLDESLATKLIGQGTTVEAVTVEGAHGLWISGPPHEFLYETGGDIQVLRSRLVGDTLVWERDGTLYRIESGLGRDRTIAIAESMR